MLAALWRARAGRRGRRARRRPIEGELNLITPVSKFIHDAALKAFAEYAKEKWNVTVKVNAIPAGTPVAYGRIAEWKGKPEVDIFWGGESALFEKLAEQKLLQKVEISKEAWDVHSGRRSASPSRSRSRTRTATGSAPRSSRTASSTTPGASSASGWPALEGLGRPAQPQAQGRGRAVRADPLVVVERDLRGDPLPATARSKGWDWLRKLAANTGHFTARSRDVPTVVAKGEFAAGFAVPSYMAFEEKLAGFDIKYVAPKNAFVTPEPMAILAGARNPKAARAFIEFLLTERGQKVFMERGLFSVTPKYKVQGPPGSTAETGGGVHGRRALVLRRRGRQRVRRGGGGQALGGAQDALPLGHRGQVGRAEEVAGRRRGPREVR